MGRPPRHRHGRPTARAGRAAGRLVDRDRTGRAGGRRRRGRRAGRRSGARPRPRSTTCSTTSPRPPSRVSPASSSPPSRPTPAWSCPPRCRSVTSSGTCGRRRRWRCTPTAGPTASTASCPPPSGWPLADPGRPTVLLIGDVAFLHDSNGLLGAAGTRHRPRGGGGRQRRRRHLLVPPAGRRRRRRAGSSSSTARPTGSTLPRWRLPTGSAPVETLDVAAVGRGRPSPPVACTCWSCAPIAAANVEVHRRLNGAVADAVANVDP